MRNYNSNIALLLAMLIVTTNAFAASSDEIQVYDEAINEPGELNVDNHINFIPEGVKDSGWNKEIPAHHNFRITPEFGYGLNKNWEAGLYIPFIRAASGDWYFEGAKIRMKYIADHAATGFYWGINQELGRVSHRTEEQNWNYELRPILGTRIGQWNYTVNPILSFALSGKDHTPNFEPQFKITRNITEKISLGFEHYMDLGPIDKMRNQGQETYLTIDTNIMKHDVHFGVGHGWTNESNTTTIKAIYNVPL